MGERGEHVVYLGRAGSGMGSVSLREAQSDARVIEAYIGKDAADDAA